MASEGPVAQEAYPRGKAEPVSESAIKPKDEDAPAPEQDEDEGGVWDSASLYEEILDEVEAFEYSSDGESGLRSAFHYNN
jgi:NAD-dependent histone deacetylase SIR2